MYGFRGLGVRQFKRLGVECSGIEGLRAGLSCSGWGGSSGGCFGICPPPCYGALVLGGVTVLG